jgi:hypothetical protein
VQCVCRCVYCVCELARVCVVCLRVYVCMNVRVYMSVTIGKCYVCRNLLKRARASAHLWHGCMDVQIFAETQESPSNLKIKARGQVDYFITHAYFANRTTS